MKWFGRPAFVRLAFSSEATRILLRFCTYSRPDGLWWERPFPAGSGSLFSLQFLISLPLSTPYGVCIMPGLIWKWCCSQVCKVLYHVSPLLGCHQYTGNLCCCGLVQQSLLPPMGVIPSGNSSSLTCVLITRELVRKVCVVDLNVYINIPPKALFSWVRGQNLWK